MLERGLAVDSVQFSNLTVGQRLNLLDLPQLGLTQRTISVLLPRLAFRLHHASEFDVVALGLYDSRAESIHLTVCKAGEAERKCEPFPTEACACGQVWKNQRSLLVQDLDTEPDLLVSLQSLRRLGVHTYYIFPLTTSRHKLGAVGFGSLQVVPKTNATIEFLRRSASIIAQLLDTAPSSDGFTAPKDYSQIPAATLLSLEPKLQDFDLQDPSHRDKAPQEMIGNSAPLQEVLRQVRMVATTDATVLLLGETGTGKELVARAVHRLSPRADSKFISVNCTAIPTDLLESELFGHEKGAFTGATNRRVGRFELADRGTLLLDEVGDLPSVIQPKLLRLLQDKEFERLGSNRTVRVDVRLIAATNQDLQRSIAEGRFREDLFYRLNVFPIYVPPLRERKSDIPALVRYFASRYAREAKKLIATIPAEEMDALLSWNWPGNIRELQNLIQRCVILANSSILRVPLGELRGKAKLSFGKVSAEIDRELIMQALKEARGMIGGASGAANRLGLKRTTLYAKMKKLSISPGEFEG
jgi:formate hydrogenlyase transcriptional activator